MHDHLNKSIASRLARLTALAVTGCSLLVSPAGAFQFANGNLKGSFDTTLSLGAMYRLRNPSPENYGTSNTFNGVPGLLNSVNSDDGNLNYGKGWVSQIFKVSSDLELKYGDFGALVRGYWFNDGKADSVLRGTLTDQAKDRVVRGGEVLDMYVRGKFTVAGSIPFDLRVGRQVLSLGESTFLPNGINVVNSVDLSKLRVPGSELKEAFLPVNMVKASIGVTKNVTIEPFWLLEFRRNELEPAGTYFSTNDFATRGGSKVMLGFATLPETGSLGGIPRANDREGSNFNQYGVATRVMVPELHDTEFGFYYARYNSRSPVISAVTPTGPISVPFVQSYAGSLATTNLAPALVANGIPAASVPASITALLGVAFGAAPSSVLAPLGLTPFLPTAQAIVAGASKVGLLTAAATGRYFTEYPEGINMFGASFNTSIGKTGISWQGEISLKRDVPLQVDDVELLFATLSSLTNTYAPPTNQIGSLLGQYSTEVPGYRRHNATTAQTTLTKVFGPTLGAQQFTVVGEVGGVWVNLPAKQNLRYDGPGTFSSQSAAAMVAGGFPTIPATPGDAFADKFSWGYQVLGRLDYNGILPNINMTPSVAFTHDVHGNTPLPLGNYIKDRRSVNLAVEFTYRNAWAFEMRYVNFFGAGRYNLLSDRDYVATTVKYSF